MICITVMIVAALYFATKERLMEKLPYIAVGFLLGFLPGKVWRGRAHLLYVIAIVVAFMLGRYLPTISISWR